MSRAFYFLILKPLSFLPLSVLYFFSDILFILIYQLFGYRKKVVRQNLDNSFPEESKQELDRIERAFFRHLCDIIIESIKLFSISAQELDRRMVFKNPEILNKYYEQNQNVILVGGHYNNWEIAAVSLDRQLPHQVFGIYSPLSNKFFNEKLAKSRTKFGVKIIKKSEVRKSFQQKADTPRVTVFGADQSPTYSKKVHWTSFLNQHTAVAIGTELFAVKYNYPVFFFKVKKVKRGYYEAVIEQLVEDPSLYKDGEISKLHTRYLEKIILENPQYWLWSHKRWKRKMTESERTELEHTAA